MDHQDYLRNVFIKLSSLKGAGVALWRYQHRFSTCRILGRLWTNVLWFG